MAAALANHRYRYPVRNETDSNRKEPHHSKLTIVQLRDFGHRLAPDFGRYEGQQSLDDEHEA